MAELTRFSTMLQAALEGGYAVPAFNIYNLESIVAALRMAAQERAPVILALGEKYFDNLRPAVARSLVDALLDQSQRETGLRLSVGLHLDHAADPQHCAEAVRAGFSSVMIDASGKAFADNVRTTRQVVEMAHAQGAEVEAELGGLAAGDASHEFTAGQEALTDPDQARSFVAETGVDALAVSVGTVHGLYQGEPHVDLERLQAIFDRLDIPLVLHGGSGTPRDLLQASIARGVAKVNVNTEVSLAAVRRIKAILDERPKAHLSELGLATIPVMQEVMAEYADRFGARQRLRD